jgi:hypothetical protein
MPQRMPWVIVKVHVCGNEHPVWRIEWGTAGKAEELGLPNMVFVRQSRFLRVFTGKIVHRRQSLLGRKGRFCLRDRREKLHRIGADMGARE